VDTVHQGDQDGSKGPYHIDAVDEVTQWQLTYAQRLSRMGPLTENPTWGPRKS